MTLNGWNQIAIYCFLIVALVEPLGWYMTRVFAGEKFAPRSCSSSLSRLSPASSIHWS
jgi:K+-transporting ATPase A subunit